ncbi:uncharacterized protein SPSK_01954 [Sporothrix schenckii 1099-18]|uniref:Uncharacterized protein n=1 Tax=Sporothrix schenckii 1099-18 TaxID=1397361 RepID=A0A0F2ME25_SPOSC|nr:uncharacterized protein SPSK_01954 [Sporothrix schenckii 1099-18]KJR87085.1 hypothetical protein SPSK_01954 [Sporothrix schenckii 1099-18]
MAPVRAAAAHWTRHWFLHVCQKLPSSCTGHTQPPVVYEVRATLGGYGLAWICCGFSGCVREGDKGRGRGRKGTEGQRKDRRRRGDTRQIRHRPASTRSTHAQSHTHTTIRTQTVRDLTPLPSLGKSKEQQKQQEPCQDTHAATRPTIKVQGTLRVPQPSPSPTQSAAHLWFPQPWSNRGGEYEIHVPVLSPKVFDPQTFQPHPHQRDANTTSALNQTLNPPGEGDDRRASQDQ